MIVLQETTDTEIVEELFTLTQLANEGHTSWTAESFAFEIASDRSLYYLAMLENTIIGYVGCMTVLDEGSISNICVHPDFQNQGIGRKLVEKVIQLARNKGIRMLYLEVRVTNQAAIALYEAVGFTKLGKRKNYYSNPVEDAVLYGKELGLRVED